MVKQLSRSITSQIAASSVAVKAVLICKILPTCSTGNHNEKEKKYPPHGNGGGRRQERAPLIDRDR
jgi:hypothetical protein